MRVLFFFNILLSYPIASAESLMTIFALVGNSLGIFQTFDARCYMYFPPKIKAPRELSLYSLYFSLSSGKFNSHPFFFSPHRLDNNALPIRHSVMLSRARAYILGGLSVSATLTLTSSVVEECKAALLSLSPGRVVLRAWKPLRLPEEGVG